jgi:outer membrane immunogenic protein
MRQLPLLVAGIVALGAVSQASTAQAQSFNWTGFYIGENGGGGWGSSSGTANGSTIIHEIDPTVTGSLTINASGILAGGQIGYNYQFPATHWVVGIEADADGSNINGSANGCSTFTSGGPVGGVASCSTSNGTLGDFGTVRGRVGYAFDNVLLYGTGGWAWGNLSATTNLTCVSNGPAVCPGNTSVPFTASTASASASASGWSAGGGVEWAFLPNWALRLEYLHLQFNGIELNYSYTGTIGILHFPFTSTASATTNLGVDIVRVGLSYLFNSWSPASATRH